MTSQGSELDVTTHPLHTAAYNGYKEMVALLLDLGIDINMEEHMKMLSRLQHVKGTGADVNAQGGEYGSALQAAAYLGHENIVYILLDKGANVNAQGGYFGTALQAAASRGHETIVQMLLNRGAEVNAVRGRYKTALLATQEQGYPIVEQILLSRGAQEYIENRREEMVESEESLKENTDVAVPFAPLEEFWSEKGVNLGVENLKS
ncbi:ankyrin repeat-containing domain protein [Favolaschia claudopus]|uniref:Ankyrin repeat-containing domain protein n=1 Tax=Favolaschia claudopus TaxID=2862362 RepID=A0AAV9ZCL3_9AGAR